uniref:Uncharacterized protein n=2 Tax=Heliothis virescens TaxID=7102 RepID=A0A2A4IU39_HELVI
MEDIYDDLSNYEDVNAVVELRNENKELKVKLEEHAAAMEKLQRDYDTLEMEFKKLENNYSSLLKTARSEIERKTQRISQLNMEKDTMVLEALKKGQTIRRHFNKGIQNKSQGNYEKPNFPDKRKETNNKEFDVKQKNIRTERYEPTARQTKDQVTDTNNRNKYESAGAREEISTSRNTNVVHKKTELNETKIQASSIRDRRKSMPVTSMPDDFFSSDEENKQNYHAKETRPDYPPMDKFDRRNTHKLPTDRHSNKTSETSSFEDRGHYYHEYSSRDNYKGRISRNTASSSYRGRDKYELSLKHRKQYSPDRGMKRKYREHQDDYQRQERGRYQGRSLESPPPEPYSRHSRRIPEPRSLSDSRHVHDHDKYTYRHEDKYTSKSKLSMDYDEPQNKRLRKESFGKPDAHSREDRRYYNEKESTEGYRDLEFSPPEYETQRYSCQSPDLVHAEAASTEPIEIKTATTSTPIQDPRLTDSKYVLKQENGTETISTTVGRNIDLIPVDKSKWNVAPVDVPCALMQQPSEYRDDIVKEIYMDIDSPNTDAHSAVESNPYSSNDDYNENFQVTKEFAVMPEETDYNSRQATDVHLKDSQQFSINKYRIPKVGQDKNNARSKMDVPIIDLGVLEPQTDIHDKVTSETDVRRRSTRSQERRERLDNVHHMNKHCDTVEDKIGIQKRKANMAIVADDLELSDDNSDHLDIDRHTVPENNQKKSTAQVPVMDVRCEVSVHRLDKDSSSTSSITDTVEPHSVEEVKNKEARSTKKHKSKPNPKEVRSDDSVHEMEKDSSKPSDDIEEIKNKEADCSRKPKSKLNTKEVKCDVSVHKTDKEPSKTSMSFDFVDLHNVDNVKNKDVDSARKHRSKLNAKQVTGDDSVHKTAKDSSQTSPSLETVELNDAEDVKNKEDCTRKHKSKKRKSKSKEIPKDSKESTDAIHVSEKKVKSKKEKESKPKETKETFSALFGDSSSLMTPEDLGIPTYVPISEDAQDAVDIKIDRIIDAAPLDDKEYPVIIQKENAVENTKEATSTHNDKYTDIPQNCNIREKEGLKQVKGKKAPKKKGVVIDPNELQSPVLYENMNPGTESNEPSDIVKTVVISTGKQPEIEFDNRELAITPIAEVEANEERTAADVSQVPALKEFKRLDTLKALATSTPHKDFPTSNPMETEVIKSNTIVCDSNKPVEQGVKENGATSLESQDAPDVRIFVKRRRKLAKRPAMT